MSPICTLPPMPQKLQTSEKKTVNLGIRISPSLHEALGKLAEADDRTVSYMAEKAIREFVERNEKKTRRT